MSSGVVLYGGISPRPWEKTIPDVIPAPQPFPMPDTGRDMRELIDKLMQKKQAVVAVQRTEGGFKVKITLDGVLVAETEVTGESAAMTVGL